MTKEHIIIMQFKRLVTLFLISPALIGCGQAALTPTPAKSATQAEVNEATSDIAHGHKRETEADSHIEAQMADQGSGQADIELPHIHGMGFSADGRQLFVAAHDGLRVFSDRQWLVPDLPVHDYMGYAATDSGFYSSGHPHPSSGLVNPLGLVKSEDSGQTLTSLGFEGESDFHLMGVGYKTHAIYVLNPAPNSKLSVGMYYSLDEGQIWQQSALEGVTANPIQIAVHPTEANEVALATEEGLLLSDNYGDTFDLAGEKDIVTAASFAPQGAHLLFGTQNLFTYHLTSDQITSVPSPALSADDAIAYIVINPVRAEEIVLATFNRSMYLSDNGGQSWVPIAQDGKTVSED